MSTAFDQKSIFLHDVPAVLDGDPERIAAWLVAHGFKTIIPKCADGAYELRVYGTNFPAWLLKWGKLGHVNVDQTFVDTMHAAGISVIGWGFNYGNNPEGEGLIAAQICDRLGLDGWIFDIETNFENYSDCVGRAGKLIGKFTQTLKRHVPTAFCSWAYYWSRTGSQIHKPEIGRFLMGWCDYIMPMVYWNRIEGSGPVQMTDEQVIAYCYGSWQQQKQITSKPIIPTLRAYTMDGGFANAGNVTAAGAWARGNFTGCSWWFLDQAAKLPDVSDALALTPGWDNDIPPIDPTNEKIYILVDLKSKTFVQCSADTPCPAYHVLIAVQLDNGAVTSEMAG